MLDSVFERFIEKSPVSVMMRGVMERVFAPELMNELFETTARVQYTKELLFSDLVELMVPVVCGLQPSVRASYQDQAEAMPASLSAVYSKLNGIELAVSQTLLRDTAKEMREVVGQLGGQAADWLRGYRVKILDGFCLEATEHRPQVCRAYASAMLPGKSLVVLEPQVRLATDVFLCEDAHAQERSLIGQVLETVQAQDLWICDRNFCTVGCLRGMAQRQAAFVIRQHGNLPMESTSDLVQVGTSETGTVWEQTVVLTQDKHPMTLRRIVVQLFEPTQEGDTEIAMMTNLSATIASAVEVCELYRNRWTIEGFFHSLTLNLEGEINTLAYPKAALFSHCMALVCLNLLSVVRAALASVHGIQKIEASLSDYYLVNQIQSVYGGMMIAIPPEHWQVFETLTLTEFVQLLKQLAQKVQLSKFLKAIRAPKKKQPARIRDQHPHRATARLLNNPPSSP
jgi:Transposase DDE domain